MPTTQKTSAIDDELDYATPTKTERNDDSLDEQMQVCNPKQKYISPDVETQATPLKTTTLSATTP